MRIESLQTGQPKTYGWPDAQDPLDREWTSAIRKEQVYGQVWAGVGGLSGDQVADRRGHGGPDRAVLVYSGDHYPKWRAEWGRKAVGPGAFGENLTVNGLTEDTVCVGDVFRIGDVRIEVSAPREPCMNLVRLHRIPDLVKTVQGTARSGWYARVLEEGWLEAGMPIALADRPYPQWTIARAALVKRKREEFAEEARLLGACPALIEEWRRKLGKAEGAKRPETS